MAVRNRRPAHWPRRGVAAPAPTAAAWWRRCDSVLWSGPRVLAPALDPGPARSSPRRRCLLSHLPPARWRPTPAASDVRAACCAPSPSGARWSCLLSCAWCAGPPESARPSSFATHAGGRPAPTSLPVATWTERCRVHRAQTSRLRRWDVDDGAVPGPPQCWPKPQRPGRSPKLPPASLASSFRALESKISSPYRPLLKE